jgi:hypothetical protein
MGSRLSLVGAREMPAISASLPAGQSICCFRDLTRSSPRSPHQSEPRGGEHEHEVRHDDSADHRCHRGRPPSHDGFIVWTTSDDDPVVAAVRSTRRPAVVHGGPALPGLELVSIDNRAAARAIGTMAFAGATLPAILSQPHDSRAIATRPRQCLRPRRTRRKSNFYATSWSIVRRASSRG